MSFQAGTPIEKTDEHIELLVAHIHPDERDRFRKMIKGEHIKQHFPNDGTQENKK